MANDHPSPRDAVSEAVEDGVLHGVAAFGLGVAATMLLVLADGYEGPEDRLFDVSGWIFYNAQFVDVAVEYDDGTGYTADLLAAASDHPYAVLTSTIPAEVYYLLPVVALVGAGVRLVVRSESELTAPAAAAVGATLVAGYFPAATLGTVIFRRTDAFATVSPELLPAMAIAGVVYPVVCGGLGGLLAAELPLPGTECSDG